MKTYIVYKCVINNLMGITSEEYPINYSPEAALEFLRRVTKQDFGYDADTWTKFFDGELDESFYTAKLDNKPLDS
jgi:hypothetical protein